MPLFVRRPRRCPQHRGHGQVSRSTGCSAGRRPRRPLRSTEFQCAVPAHSERISFLTACVHLCDFLPSQRGGRAGHPSLTPLPGSPPALRTGGGSGVRVLRPPPPEGLLLSQSECRFGIFSLCIRQSVTGQRKRRGNFQCWSRGWLRRLKPSRERLPWPAPWAGLSVPSPGARWPPPAARGPTTFTLKLRYIIYFRICVYF